MSATFGMNRLNVEAFGKETTVPNNNLAKLMYYLHCISTVIEYDDYNILTDYQHYNNLTIDQMKEVYKLAILFNPKIFIDAGIFIVNPDLLPPGWSNHFYKITDETIGMHVNEQIVVGGRTVRVLNVMVCDSSWVEINYIIPLEALINEIERRLNPGLPYTPILTETETSMISNSPIIINQTIEFKNSPISILCPYCKNPIRTTTKSELNCLACCCCLLFNLLYIFFKACANGDICCCNVIHYCPKCGRMLGKYKTC